MAVDETRDITFYHASHHGTENDETMATYELRIREVLIRPHRAPDDTSLHSEKHLLSTVSFLHSFYRYLHSNLTSAVGITKNAFHLDACNGPPLGRRCYEVIPFDHDVRRCLLRAGNRT
uniref:Uncharacterized protein n=1 Tax=Strigamia maritima TaxID=126957 RepID=T1IGY8_STRMM